MDKVIIKQEELENTPNYILYTQSLGDIDATLDNVKDAINNTDNGGYFSEINETLANLVAQTFELNKTMNNIAKSLRIISQNKR